MKTKLDVRIYNVTEFSLPILEMIGAHNSGKTLINLSVIEAHVKTLAVFGKDCDCMIDKDLMSISENGKIILTISEKVFMGSVQVGKPVKEIY